MNPKDWQPSPRTERIYAASVQRLLHRVFPEIEWEEEGAPNPAEIPSIVEQELFRQAEDIARRMVTVTASRNARSWRAAARQSMHGRRIYQALRTELNSQIGVRVDELVAAQASAIRTLPLKIANRAAAWVQRQQVKGVRSEVIRKTLEEKFPALLQHNARTFARTQVAKAETALTQARAERLGLYWYEWATSEDQRVRPSHRKMDKVLVMWSDPPSPEQLAGEKPEGHYAPGGIYNCRCLALPLVMTDEVTWPHKVYAHGQIAMTQRHQFERFNRMAGAA